MTLILFFFYPHILPPLGHTAIWRALDAPIGGQPPRVRSRSRSAVCSSVFIFSSPLRLSVVPSAPVFALAFSCSRRVYCTICRHESMEALLFGLLAYWSPPLSPLSVCICVLGVVYHLLSSGHFSPPQSKTLVYSQGIWVANWTQKLTIGMTKVR